MIQIFQSFIDKINNLFVKFNQNFINYIKMKQDELNKALTNLINTSYYDQLEGFNKMLYGIKYVIVEIIIL